MHSFNDKIATVRNADCVVEWEKVGGKLVTEGVSDVTCNKPADGSGYPKWAKFSVVSRVLVETEEIYISKVTFDRCG